MRQLGYRYCKNAAKIKNIAEFWVNICVYKLFVVSLQLEMKSCFGHI